MAILIFHFFNKEFSVSDLISAQMGTTTFFNSGTSPDIHKFHFKWFPTFLLLLASIITSLSFSEYGDSRSRTFHLSLPSSTTEKWLSKVIISLIISPIVLIALYQAFIWVSSLWPSVDEYYQVPVSVWDPYLRPQIIYAILLQGIVILASIWYKKYSIGKAIIAFICIAFIFNLVLMLSIVLLSDNSKLLENLSIQSLASIEGFIRGSRLSTSVQDLSFSETFLNQTSTLSLVCLGCLGLSFLKFKEMEA